MMAITEQQFNRLDYALGRFLAQRSKLENRQKVLFEQLVAKLNFDLGNGHSCIAVNAEQQDLLQASGMASSDQKSPLILENGRLYFYRYWCYEKRLAERVLKLVEQANVLPNLEGLLARYFPESTDTVDWQRVAVSRAVGQSFSIITGGPGTGKTTTVVKLLALIVELSAQELNIALVAPTGKAAMRLQEAIVQNKQRLPCDQEIEQRIPETVTTIHRLLGTRPPSPYFIHDADNPLPYDLIVVDEASMVDLALMTKLVDALHTNAGIILLGDKDQLASVESGAVLADMTLALPEHAHELKTAYRFNNDIRALADAVNQQDSQFAWHLLMDQQQVNTCVLDKDLINYIVDQLQEYWHLVNSGAEVKELFRCFSRFQVLCVNRNGANSVSDINVRIEKQFLESFNEQWYVGRPIMIARNHAGMQLYNGDIGICLANPEQDNRLMVYFERPDGSVKKFLPSRLPSCETVFAMTIHKSQGSEFNEVLIVLPDRMNPILTKELVYTGITRAREYVKIVTSKEIFEKTLQQKVFRMGGLAQRLQHHN